MSSTRTAWYSISSILSYLKLNQLIIMTATHRGGPIAIGLSSSWREWKPERLSDRVFLAFESLAGEGSQSVATKRKTRMTRQRKPFIMLCRDVYSRLHNFSSLSSLFSHFASYFCLFPLFSSPFRVESYFADHTYDWRNDTSKEATCAISVCSGIFGFHSVWQLLKCFCTSARARERNGCIGFRF